MPTDASYLKKKSDIQKIYKEAAQKVFELYELNDDRKTLEKYAKELEEKWLGYACVFEENEVVNLCQDDLDIEYYPFYMSI